MAGPRRLPLRTPSITFGDGLGANRHLTPEEELWAADLIQQRYLQYYGGGVREQGPLDQELEELIQAFPADPDLPRAAEILRWGTGARGMPELTPRLNFVPDRDPVQIETGPEDSVVSPPLQYQPTRSR